MSMSGKKKEENKRAVKPFAFAMILAFGMFCAACGKEEKAPEAAPTEAVTQTEPEADAEPVTNVTDDGTTDVEVQDADATLPEDVDDSVSQLGGTDDGDDEKSGSSAFTFGTQSGDVYENESVGYGCKLDGWIFSDEAALAAMSGYKETLPKDVKDIIDQSPFWMDMFAQSPDSMQNINVQLCNMKKQYGMAMEQGDVESLYESMLPMLKSTYQQSGATDVNMSIGDVKMAGDSFKAIVTTAKISGMKVFIKQIFICKGDYASIITVSAYSTDKTDEVFGYFYKLD